MREAELEMSHWTQAGVAGVRMKIGPEIDGGEAVAVPGAELSLLVSASASLPSPPCSRIKTRARTEASQQHWLGSNRQIFLLFLPPFISSSDLASFFPLIFLVPPIPHPLLLQHSVGAAGSEAGNVDSDKHWAQHAVHANGALAK